MNKLNNELVKNNQTEEREEQYYQEYLSLIELKREIEDKLTSLKTKCKDIFGVDNKRFFIESNRYTFKAKNIKELPKEFITINNTELTKLYKSMLGGKQLLKKYSLKVNEVKTYSFKPKKGNK